MAAHRSPVSTLMRVGGCPGALLPATTDTRNVRVVLTGQPPAGSTFQERGTIPFRILKLHCKRWPATVMLRLKTQIRCGGSLVAKDSHMARSALVSRVLENGPTPLTFHLTAFQNMSYLLWRECDEKESRTKLGRPSALDHSTIQSKNSVPAKR